MADLLLRHLVEHLRRVRIGAAQPVGEGAIDAVVLVLVGDGEREDFLLAQIGKALHVVPLGMPDQIIGTILKTKSRPLTRLSTQGRAECGARSTILDRNLGQLGTGSRHGRIRRAFEPLLRRVLHFYWRFSRGMTLGVRGLVIDGEGRVFLVKHSYVAGWHLPGGGVETGETLLAALARELREEGNIELTGHAGAARRLFQSARVAARPRRALRRARVPPGSRRRTPNREIVAHGFFAPDALPADATRGTRERIAEVLHGVPVAEQW